MLIRSKLKYLKYAVILAIPCAMQSCSEMPQDKNARKKMPTVYMPTVSIPGLPGMNCDFATAGDQQIFPFRVTQVDYSLNGTVSGYTRVSIPNEQYDSIAFDMAQSYRQVATGLLEHWAATSDKGIIIDLSNGNVSTLGAQYSVQAAGRNVPVIILWDQQAVTRASAYKELIGGFPGIVEINGLQPARMHAYSCFK
ncbi:hypothetical protein ACE38W_04015 [Chitinophaga sp. Hz27]|uniref:hypothetical protein n=1 Tax=Chitinophaga sp. Hz27 TaxID=3347169 RepID=UPI0035D5EA17